MKVLVLEPFLDKKEGITRQKGDTFEVDKERLEELRSNLPDDYIQVDETTPKKKAVTKTKKDKE